MQVDQQTYRLSFQLALMEGIGALFLGLGIPSVIGGLDIVPAEYLFAGYGPVFVGVGVLLMLPGLISLLRQLKERSGSGEGRDH